MPDCKVWRSSARLRHIGVFNDALNGGIELRAETEARAPAMAAALGCVEPARGPKKQEDSQERAPRPSRAHERSSTFRSFSSLRRFPVKTAQTVGCLHEWVEAEMRLATDNGKDVLFMYGFCHREDGLSSSKRSSGAKEAEAGPCATHSRP